MSNNEPADCLEIVAVVAYYTLYAPVLIYVIYAGDCLLCMMMMMLMMMMMMMIVCVDELALVCLRLMIFCRDPR